MGNKERYVYKTRKPLLACIAHNIKTSARNLDQIQSIEVNDREQDDLSPTRKLINLSKNSIAVKMILPIINHVIRKKFSRVCILVTYYTTWLQNMSKKCGWFCYSRLTTSKVKVLQCKPTKYRGFYCHSNNTREEMIIISYHADILYHQNQSFIMQDNKRFCNMQSNSCEV